MKHKNLSKPIPPITSTTIDADVLARINDKVAKAHEQNENPYVYHGPRTAASGPPDSTYSVTSRK
jgi:hypothetical protein